MTARRSDSFVMISTDAVFDKRLAHGAVRVLAALAAYTDKEGECWPSEATLAQKIGMTERHTRRSLRALEEAGHIKIKRRPGQSSIYHLPRTLGTEAPRTLETGVSLDPGHKVPLPRTLETGDPGPEGPTNYNQGTRTKNHYAFDGKIIRLNKEHLETWRQRYHAIPDLEAELAGLDSWYVGTDAKKGKGWFHRAQRSLNEKHQERLAAKQAQQREEPKFNDGVY